MKNAIYTLAMLAITFSFMGCPYSSKVTLDENPSEKTNSAYFGNYEKKGSSTYTYRISKESETIYKIEEISNSDKSSIYDYYGYTTTIGGTQFLVTYEENKSGGSPEKYYFYKLESTKSGSMFTLFELTEAITEEFTSSKDLKNYISKYKDLSFFYNKSELKFYRLD